MKKRCKVREDTIASKQQNNCLLERFLTDSCNSLVTSDDDTKTTYSPDHKTLNRPCSNSHRTQGCTYKRVIAGQEMFQDTLPPCSRIHFSKEVGNSATRCPEDGCQKEKAHCHNPECQIHADVNGYPELGVKKIEKDDRKKGTKHNSFENYISDQPVKQPLTMPRTSKVMPLCKEKCIMMMKKNCLLASGILVIGGITSLRGDCEDRGGDQVWLYFVEEQSWRELPKIPQRKHSHGACLQWNCIFVTGGIDPKPRSGSPIPTSTTFVFDSRLGLWHDGIPLTSPRSHHKMSFFQDKIWVFGGKDNRGRYTDQVEYLSNFSQCWTKATSMPSARGGLCISLHQRHVFIVGGRCNGEQSNGPTEPLETMSFDGIQWHWQAELDSGRFCAGLTEANGVLCLVGGGHHHSCSNDEYSTTCFSSIVVYDDAKKEWRRIQNLCIPRYNMGCAATGSKIYIFGGITVDPLREEMILLDSVECYNVRTQCMLKMFQLPRAVAGLECLLIPDVHTWCQ